MWIVGTEIAVAVGASHTMAESAAQTYQESPTAANFFLKETAETFDFFVTAVEGDIRRQQALWLPGVTWAEKISAGGFMGVANNVLHMGYELGLETTDAVAEKLGVSKYLSDLEDFSKEAVAVREAGRSFRRDAQEAGKAKTNLQEFEKGLEGFNVISFEEREHFAQRLSMSKMSEADLKNLLKAEFPDIFNALSNNPAAYKEFISKSLGYSDKQDTVRQDEKFKHRVEVKERIKKVRADLEKEKDSKDPNKVEALRRYEAWLSAQEHLESLQEEILENQHQRELYEKTLAQITDSLYVKALLNGFIEKLSKEKVLTPQRLEELLGLEKRELQVFLKDSSLLQALGINPKERLPPAASL